MNVFACLRASECVRGQERLHTSTHIVVRIQAAHCRVRDFSESERVSESSCPTHLKTDLAQLLASERSLKLLNTLDKNGIAVSLS